MPENEAEKEAFLFREESRDIPLPPNEVPPEDCPKPWLKSTIECAGLTNSNVCLKCSVGISQQERHQ